MKKSLTSLVFLAVMGTFVVSHTPTYAAYPTINAVSVLAHTNAQRYRNGMTLLDSDGELSHAAAMKMQDLFAHQYFAHVSPSGESISDLARRVGYTYLAVGENLALGDFASSKEVVEAWMKSPGHRKNILSRTYSEIGIAAGRGRYDGRNTWIVVQAFGLPKSTCPDLNENLGQKIDVLENRLELLEIITGIRQGRVEEEGISQAIYRDRVSSYNTAAELYNSTAETYRALIERYNEGVESYNDCVTTRVAEMSDS